MRTCPAPGFGISRSTISKSAPGFGTSATFIFAMGDSPFFILDSEIKFRCAARAIGHIFQRRNRPAEKKFAQRKSKKFCNDFRSDAQALRLTRTGLPLTIRETV